MNKSHQIVTQSKSNICVSIYIIVNIAKINKHESTQIFYAEVLQISYSEKTCFYFNVIPMQREQINVIHRYNCMNKMIHNF